VHPIATLALLSGARRGELLALRWCDLDVDKGSIRIERSLEHTRAGGLRFKEPKTPDSVRVISLPAGAVEALKAHRVRQLKQRMMLGQGGRPELVFTTLDGDPITPDVLSKAWSRQTAAKGMPQVHFHALRHTHASMLISEGIDIVQISKRLGHASPTITLNTYSHLFKKDDDDLVSALEKALGGKI
jgi:integrase